MPLLNISLVTQELIQVIQNALNAVTWPGGGGAPSVYPEPPSLMEEPLTGIGIYMYHIAEDPHYKNLPPIGRDQPPLRHTPMGLNLYYHLSAHDVDTQDISQRTFNEQRMMGLAVKALRDNPELTVISALPSADSNRLKIYLNPIPANDAVNFWTAGDSHIKLSTYYEVSIALLEPEPIQSRSGRVLSVGVHTFAEGAPRIMSTKNTITFTAPDNFLREIELQPAQVPMSSRFEIMGTGFSGDNLTLLLIREGWASPAIANSGDWVIEYNSTNLYATAFPTATLIDGGVVEDVLPGVYGAQIRTERRRRLPNGQIRIFEHLSNQCPFVIAPRIDNVSVPNVQGVFTVTGYIFDGADIDLRVYIGPNQYALGAFNVLNEGEYAVNPGDNTQLQIRHTADLAGVANVPIRIFINEVESPPAWIPSS